MLLTKPPGVITFQVHPESRGMLWGLGILTRVCSKNPGMVKNIKTKIIILGQRGDYTPMTKPLTKGGKEETHEGVIARSGLLPMRMRHAQMTVTVSGGMRAHTLKLTIVTRVTHVMQTRT